MMNHSFMQISEYINFEAQISVHSGFTQKKQ